jgi:hypothetical protein
LAKSVSYDFFHFIIIYFSVAKVVVKNPSEFEALSFGNQLAVYGKDLLHPCPTLKLEKHAMSAISDYLFSTFVTIRHIWKLSTPSAT